MGVNSKPSRYNSSSWRLHAYFKGGQFPDYHLPHVLFPKFISVRISLGFQSSFSHITRNGIPSSLISVLCITLGISSSRVPNKQINGINFRDASLDNLSRCFRLINLFFPQHTHFLEKWSLLKYLCFSPF